MNTVMNTRNIALGKNIPTREHEKASKRIFRYQLQFCRMWIREFGVMPTRWIINDYSKQLTNSNIASSVRIKEEELTDFTIQFINGYH